MEVNILKRESTMNTNSICAGSRVVLEDNANIKMPRSFLSIFGFELGNIYYVQEVEIVPKETILPIAYIERGFIPSVYAKYLSRGIRTTNHDNMGSDCFVTINGKKLSAVWFRPATAKETNQHARSLL